MSANDMSEVVKIILKIGLRNTTKLSLTGAQNMKGWLFTLASC
jgi:hypothetical protein